MVKFKINGQLVDVQDGLTVLQAAESLGIQIPTLCYHKDLSPFGGCRLCVVEVRGARLPMTSCNLPVTTGLIVQTESPALTRYRQAVLRMLLSNYYDAGYTRRNRGTGLDEDSELARWCREYQVDVRQNMAPRPLHPVDSDPNPFVWVDMNKCIQCTRCVRACAEIQGRFVWAQAYRGYQARIVAGADSTMLASRCESCGACVVYCPTGALDNKMSITAGQADRLVRTTCTYCSVGCQLDLNVKDDSQSSAGGIPGGRVIRVTSHKDGEQDSVNRLHLCLKGRYGYEFIHSPQRHARPRVRQYLLDENSQGSPAARTNGSGKLVETDWDTALKIAAQGLSAARRMHGSDAVGVLASGRLLNEENYLLNKLARQVLGTNNIDCSANLYSTSVVDGLVEALGLPAMSSSFDDIASNAGSLLVIGSNLSEQHPVFGAHLRQAVLRRKLKLVVASPDFVNIAEYAALALYHHPNREAALAYGLMHILLEKGWHEPAAIVSHPQGFAALNDLVEGYTPQRTAELTGLSVESLYKAAEILSHNRPAGILWSTGLADPERGRDNVQALANLELLLGDVDRPGGGVVPLRSQCSLQGACDMGALPAWLPGYQPVSDAQVRLKFEQAWGTEIPLQPGMQAAAMLRQAGTGGIRALYILGEDLLNSTPQAAAVRRSLEACEFVVLQECASSETTRYADVVLPGVTFAEKTGTFTSAERRVQLVHQAIQPLGEARPDWKIIAGLAQRVIHLENPRYQPSYYSVWDYKDSDQIMQEIAHLTPIYAGVSHARLAQGAGLQWPVPSAHDPGSERLQSGAFSSGKVQWAAVE
jgi:predicted molibdopterin-dependent oxidoreductase YjgC